MAERIGMQKSTQVYKSRKKTQESTPTDGVDVLSAHDFTTIMPIFLFLFISLFFFAKWHLVPMGFEIKQGVTCLEMVTVRAHYSLFISYMVSGI